MAYRDDREALLSRADALERELASERQRAKKATAEVRKLRRDLGHLTRALGRGVVLPAPAASRLLPLVVASLAGAATLVGVNVGRVRPPSAPVAVSGAEVTAAIAPSTFVDKALDPPKVRLVPSGMGLLTVDARPLSYVWLDDQRLSATPLQALPVQAGLHTLRLEAPGRPTVLRRVRITEGQETNLLLGLGPERVAMDRGP